MITAPESSSHKTSELVAYHKVKRIFLSLKDMEQEDPDQLQICEFNGQNFELIAGQGFTVYDRELEGLNQQ